MARKKDLQFSKDLPSTWEEALKQYLWFKQAEGLREATIKGNRDVIRLFYKRHPEAWGQSNPKMPIYEFMAEKIMPATYNIRRNYLRQYFNWGIKEGLFAGNPMDGLKKRKDEGRVVTLKADTLSALLKLPDTNTFTGLRDYAALLLTLDTGIRPKEAFSLLPADINWQALEVYIRSEVAKTKVSRTLPISPITAQTIKDLLQSRHSDWRDGTPVFCTDEGRPMNRHNWSDRIEKYSKMLGVKIKPYDLRHAFALQFLRNGGHALALQRTMGHADLSMTKRYVALTQEDLKEQHSMASPLNVLLPQRKRVRKI